MKKEEKKLDYITIGIIDISQYTVPYPESFSGGGGGGCCFFSLLTPEALPWWGLRDRKFYEDLEC